jgi:hypothetical protein
MDFPLKMSVLSLDKHPSSGALCVECFYEVVDSKGETIVPRNHFVCKAKDFDIVAKYTLEGITARFAQTTPMQIESSPEVAAQIRDLRALVTQEAEPEAPPATPLDQTISPPGPTRKALTK